MIWRAGMVYAAGGVFYCLLPLLLGLVEAQSYFRLVWVLLLPTLFFVADNAKKAVGRNGLGQRRYEVALEFWYWLSAAVLLFLCFSVYFRAGAAEGRNELFELRQSVLSSWAVVVINIGIVSAACLSLRNRWRLIWLILPLVFEVLTQSRSFIVAALISAYVVGIVPGRFFLLAPLPVVLVSISRMDGDFSIAGVSYYIAAESINTAVGSALVDFRDYAVTVEQALRPLLSLLPFAGGFLPIPSEAVQYNEYLKEAFDVYGLAFGLIGFAKFASIWVVLLTVSSGFLVLAFLRYLGVPAAFVLIQAATLIPMFFRWSPGEFFYLLGRISLIFWVSVALGALLERYGSARGPEEK